MTLPPGVSATDRQNSAISGLQAALRGAVMSHNQRASGAPVRCGRKTPCGSVSRSSGWSTPHWSGCPGS